MREKSLKVIISFPTTMASIVMEKACLAEGIPGRLIPLPSVISAGCGMSWMSAAEDEEILRNFMKDRELSYDKIHILYI